MPVSPAVRRLRRAQRRADALAIGRDHNPLMCEPVPLQRTRFTPDRDIARTWDAEASPLADGCSGPILHMGAWIKEEARERVPIHMVRDYPTNAATDATARARISPLAGANWLDIAGPSRSTDDSAMHSKPSKRVQRGSGDDVDTWLKK